MKRLLSGGLAALLLWSMLSVSALAGTGGDAEPSGHESPRLRLHSGDVDMAGLRDRPEPQSLAPDQPRLYVVQFKSVITDQSWSAMEEAGVEVGPYVPDFAFVIRATPSQVQALARHDLVRAVARFRPEWKLSPRLKEAGPEADVAVFGFPGQGETLGADLSAMAARAERSQVGVVLKGLARARLEELAANEAVLFLDLAPERKLLNQTARGIMRVDTPGGPWVNGLTGAGQLVAVADTGLDTGVAGTLHPDLAERLVGAASWGRMNDWSDPHGHGTHVAASVLGDGSASHGAYAGVAPEADLFFQSLLNPSGGLTLPYDLFYLFEEARDAGASLHTNSWGGGFAYDDFSAMVDEYVWEHKDFAILFAAGNSGESGAGSIVSPGNAKNAITVGASESLFPGDSWGDNPNEVAVFSSRGPTQDGRIKPDVVAPGTWILSARSSLAPSGNFWDAYDSRYAYMGGTSMATPLTAGAAALVRQYLQEVREVANPSASLIKALLINGARDMGGGWGTSGQGWGRVDLANTLYPDGSRRVQFEEGPALATNGSQTYTYDVREGEMLKITLVWSDRGGAPVGGKQLVNDLDLTVTGPDKKVYKGNCFNSARTTASTGCASYDRVNNVENVYIAAPATGTYTVRVRGYNVPKGPQTYSLVVSGNLTDLAAPVVQLTAPAPNTLVKGSVLLTAEATDNQGVAWVEFYAGNTRIGADDDPSDGWSYIWNSAGVSGAVQLRAEAHDHDGNVGISKPVSVTVDNALPTISVTSPANGAFVAGKVNVTVNATDDRGIQKVEFRVGDQVRHTDTTAPYTWVWDTVGTSAADGSYTITARAYDRAGNTTDATLGLTVDNTAPALSLNLANGSAVPAGEIPVTATATDANGVARVEFFVGSTKIGTDANGADGFQATWKTAGLRSTTYQVKAVAYDAAGNSRTSTATVTVDGALPVITTTSPAPGAHLTGTVTVAGKVTDNVGVTKVEIYLGEELAATMTPPAPVTTYQYAWPWATQGDGPRVLTIKAYDGAGNSSTRSLDLFVDHTPPAVSLASPAAGGLVPIAATVTAQASDNARVARVEFYLDGKLAYTDTTAPYAWDWNTAKLANGSSHTLTARAYDAAGLSTTSAPVNVVVDNVAPSSVSLQAGSLLRGVATATANVGPSDGVAQVRFYVDGALVRTDTEAPFTATVDTTSLSNGKHKLEAVALDGAGNSRSTSLTVTVDNAAPTFTAAGLTDGQKLKGSPSITLSARDNLQLAQILVYLDANPGAPLVSKAITGSTATQTVSLNTAGGPDGPHTLHVRLVDQAGNTTDTTYDVIFDNTAPAVTFTAPAIGAKLPAGPVSVSASVTDEQGVARVEFYAGSTRIGTDTNGADGWSATWNITGKSRSGENVLKIVAYDQAANMATVTRSVLVDPVAPSVSLTSPSAGAVVSGSSVPVSAKITDKQSIARVELLVGGAKVDEVVLDSPATSYTYSATWNSTAVASGPQTVVVRATDTFGNVAEKSVSVKVDNDGPSASLIAPADGGYVGSKAVVTASLSDVGGGIKKIEVLVDGKVKHTANLSKPVTSHNFSWTWSTAGLATDTAHTLMIRVTDAAGNVATDSATVSIDTTAPSASIDSPVSGYLTGTQEVRVTAVDNIGVARAEIYLGSTRIATVDGSGEPEEVLTYSWNTTAHKDGSHTLKVMVYDLAGNTVTRTVSVKVDNGLPTVKIESPRAGATVKGTVTVRASASDGVAVEKVEFYLDGELMSTDTTSSYTWSWKTTETSNGSHTITAKAYDKVGNTRTSSVAVTVSN